jgi:uncharacterized protein YecE (DUF72 family)
VATAWIGTSGYSYPHWAGVFYPKGLPERRRFEHYAEHLSSVELNVTFYRLPQPAVFEGWARRAPSGFCFVLKGSRFITHLKRLSDTTAALDAFFSRAALLKERLGCVLWQLPPRFHADPERLRAFLREIAASKQAVKTRQAFEFRDPSWFTESVYEVLREANAAVVLADWPFQVLPPAARARTLNRPIVRVPHTADWIYLRRHGPGRPYGSNYTPAMVRADARRVRQWLEEGKEVYAFYNNDAAGHAVKNARFLAEEVAR